MYLRTPKKYTSRRRRQGVISLRWLWLWLLTPLVVLVGYTVYENRDSLVPQVQDALDGVLGDANSVVATARAPQPTPTPDPSASVSRADDAWERGAIQEAVGLYAEVIDNVPNDVAVHYHYAMGLLMQGLETEGLAAATNTVTANPFTADAWSVQAMAYNFNRQYGDAIASALQALTIASREAVEANPALAISRSRALAHLAQAYYHNEQYARAQSSLDEALELDPDNAHAYYVQGLLDQDVAFDLASARSSFATAYDLAPNLPYLGNQLALAEFALGNYAAMEAIYEGILELNPSNTPALFRIGNYYFRIVGDWGQAADYQRRCVDAEPENANCHYILGRALTQQELYTDALSAFQAAARVADEDDSLLGYYYFWIGNTHINLLDCDNAVFNLRESYRVAVENEDEGLAGDASDLAGTACGAAIGVAQPVATPTPPADDGGGEAEEGA